MLTRDSFYIPARLPFLARQLFVYIALLHLWVHFDVLLVCGSNAQKPKTSAVYGSTESIRTLQTSSSSVSDRPRSRSRSDKFCIEVSRTQKLYECEADASACDGLEVFTMAQLSSGYFCFRRCLSHEEGIA